MADFIKCFPGVKSWDKYCTVMVSEASCASSWKQH